MPDSIHQPDSARRGQISRRIDSLSPSGIRRFFDLLATMEDVISLGVGQPDFVTPAVIEGLNIAMGALIDFGDEVLCPDPHFVAYPAAVVLADGVVVPVPTSDANSFKLRAQDLEERITPPAKAL